MWFFERSTGRRTTCGRSLPRRIIFCSAAASHSSRQLQAEAVEAPPIRRFDETVCDAMNLFGICTGISCPSGHVRSVCTATELDFIVTVGCRWAETAADTTAAEVGPLRRTVLCCWMTICRAWGKGDVLLRFHPLDFFFSEPHRAFP